MRMKPSSRTKKPRANKTVPRISRGVAAAAVGVAAIVFIGAAALMSARTAVPTPAPKPIAKLDATATSDMSLDPLPAEAPRAETSAPGTVTIIGCVQRDAEGLRLVETSGDAAPKARSWKSGFLKKRTAPVDLVGVPKSLKLPTYVGQRVSVTGTLDERELQVKSVRRIAASCTN